MENEREYVTRIEIQLVWTHAREGQYHPVVEVSGDVPDGLDKVKLVQYFMNGAIWAMSDPSLAVDGAQLNPAGFME